VVDHEFADLNVVAKAFEFGSQLKDYLAQLGAFDSVVVNLFEEIDVEGGTPGDRNELVNI
jgi:hypothetical protein